MAADGRSGPVKIGVVGAGFIGQLAHLDSYAAIDGCCIVALAESRPKLRHLVSQRYGIPRTYALHHELIRDPEVEAVVVVTPRSMTGPIALDCLKAGKHLFTEKPMAATVEQAERLVEAAQARGLRYAVGYMRRHDEGIQQAKQLLDDLLATGELGPITFVRAHCFAGDDYCNIDGHIVTSEKVPKDLPGWPIAPDWVPEHRQSDYAYFLNVFCHNVNLLRYLLGHSPSVKFVRLADRRAQVVILDYGAYMAVLEFGTSESRTWDEVTEIYFTHGRLKILPPPALLRNVPAQVEIYKGNDSHQVCSSQPGWTWAFRRQAEAFIEDNREGRQPVASGADALEDMRLIEQIWRLELNGR